MALMSVIVLASLLWAINKKEGVIFFESFSPTCSHSTIRLVLALTAVPGWYSLDLDAVCAFISSDLAPGERVNTKGPAGDCLRLQMQKSKEA